MDRKEEKHQNSRQSDVSPLTSFSSTDLKMVNMVCIFLCNNDSRVSTGMVLPRMWISLNN